MAARIFIDLILITFGLSSAIAFTSDEGSDPVDGLKTYIVYVQKPKQDGGFPMEVDLNSWYESFLPAATIPNSIGGHDPDSQSRILYGYKKAISGFAARLTEEEVKAMETKEGFISAHAENTLKLHTTHTPNFLGLHLNSRFWKDSNLGKGIIIGVFDSGITPDHPSFNDEGMPPPPAKWKGTCELQGVTCNNKLIGARNFIETKGKPPIDNMGHGTHTASTAAGNFVNGANVYGQANGTAVGVAPLAHLAIYKVCNRALGCPDSAVAAAIDAAIEDGVDVISLSVGNHSIPFHVDPVAIATFTAMQHGIFASCAAGNDGPRPSTMSNEAPWLLTVGGSSTDRTIGGSAQLGNGAVYNGETFFQPKDFTSEQLPLIFPGAMNSPAEFCLPAALKGFDVKGKIVLCKRDEFTPNVQKGIYVKEAGGAAMILMNDELYAYLTAPQLHEIPAVHVSYAAGENIKAYINSTSSPTASIVFKGTMIGKKSAPEVGSFSSRGPNTASPGILKPDIIGPGVQILAAWSSSVENKSDTKSTFNMISGTSMSCPHVSGIGALLKTVHPDWSPAAIKSAIMTSADILNLDGNPLVDEDLVPADLFATGAGHVNPSRANDPGLIYDIQPDDYIPYLCGLNYSDLQVSRVVSRDIQCSQVSSIPEAALNYPSFSIKLGPTPQTYNRTVTNVGQPSSSYDLQIVAPEGVDVVVRPDKMSFTERNQKATYSVTFTQNLKSRPSFSQGYLNWISGHINVRSPIAVSF